MRAIDTIRSIATGQHGLVSTRQLRAEGVSHHTVRNHVESGWLVRVTRQVLKIGGAPSAELTQPMLAVLDGPDGSVLSHTAAAALWGIPGFRLDKDLHVVVPRRGKPGRPRTATVHYQQGLPMDHVVQFHGIPVTSPPLTMFHLAALLHPDRVERALDWAWSDGLLTGPVMNRLLERIAASGRNGVGTIRQLMETRGPGYVPPASNLEARFNRIVENVPGIPPMRRQVDLGGEYWVGRVDFVWDDLPGGVEVQSERFHTSVVDRAADAERLRKMKEAGISMIEVWDTDVFHRPWLVVQRVREFRRTLETRVLVHKGRE